MSGIFNRRFGVTKFTTQSPVWLSGGTAVNGATGTSLTTGNYVLPVPFPYYRVLAVVGKIRVTTACSNDVAITLQAVKPSTGATSTTPFTCATATLDTNNAGTNVWHGFTMISPLLSNTALAQCGFVRGVPGGTGAAWSATGAAVITGNAMPTASINDTAYTSAYREFLPELVSGTIGAAGIFEISANFLIEPAQKL